MKKIIFFSFILILSACGKNNPHYLPAKIETPVEIINTPQPTMEIKAVSEQTCEEIKNNKSGDFLIKISEAKFLLITQGFALIMNEDQSVSEITEEKFPMGEFCDLEIKNNFVTVVNFPKEISVSEPAPTPALVPSCGGWSNPCQNYQPTPPPAYGPCGPYPCPPQY